MEESPTSTRNQRYAAVAYDQVLRHVGKDYWQKYASLAKSFPALIQSCGLCQAVAFAFKERRDLLDDVAVVLQEQDISNAQTLGDRARTVGLTDYLRLSRNALAACVWIKRYVEAHEQL